MTDHPQLIDISSSPAETRDLGAWLASHLAAGDVVLLDGDLGAGKTTLVQGIARGLGITAPVASPTFILVHEFGDEQSGPLLHHLDLYRLHPDEVASLGDALVLFDPRAITVIEWPDRARDILPEAWLQVELEPLPGERRRIRLFPVGDPETVERWRAVFATREPTSGREAADENQD